MKLYQITYNSGSIRFDITNNNATKCIAELGYTMEEVISIYKSNGLEDLAACFTLEKPYNSFIDLAMYEDSNIKSIIELCTFDGSKSTNKILETIKIDHPEIFI